MDWMSSTLPTVLLVQLKKITMICNSKITAGEVEEGEQDFCSVDRRQQFDRRVVRVIMLST